MYVFFCVATFPRGDILLKEGDTLEVYCRLDLRRTKYNATFIKFVFTKTNISEDLMRTTVINETTALLQVERMNVSSSHLSCEIVPPGLPRIQVCQNEIDVGCKFLFTKLRRCRSIVCTIIPCLKIFMNIHMKRTDFLFCLLITSTLTVRIQLLYFMTYYYDIFF
jgi:hypothetical protein